MGLVHISQFYPCTKIELAGELCYVCELGKYLHEYYGDNLSLSGVQLSTVLRKSVYWDYLRIALMEGWVTETGLTEDDYIDTPQNKIDWETRSLKNVLYTTSTVPFNRDDATKRNLDHEYNLRVPKRTQVAFTRMSVEVYEFSISGKNRIEKDINNKALNDEGAKQMWLSFIAFVAVNRLKTGIPSALMISFDSTVVSCTGSLSYVLSLDDETSALHGWCYYMFDNTVRKVDMLQLGYIAWYNKGEDAGFLKRYYIPKEKQRHLKDLNISVGDPVLFYRRARKQTKNRVKEIEGANVAIVRGINQSTITVDLINTTKLKSQGKLDFDNNSTSIKSMYIEPSYTKFNVTTKTFSWQDIGIEYMMFDELCFILPLNEADDIKTQFVDNGSEQAFLNIPQNDFIYWLLKDYNAEFNEDKFLSTYFDGIEPLYKQFMETGQVPPEFYVTES